MPNSLKQFHLNIESIKIIDSIYQYFQKQLQAVDLSEILRAQFVLLISAFDCFIHDLVREGMLDVFSGVRAENNDYDNFKLPLKVVKQLLENSDETQRIMLLNTAIKQIASKDSYQSPASVVNALSLIGIKKLWTLVSLDLNMKPDDIQKTLSLIINRRNKIAHEADIDVLSGEKNIIDRADIITTLEFVEKLAIAIEKQVNFNIT